MPSTQYYNELGVELQYLLELEHPPIAISFTNEPPVGVRRSTNPFLQAVSSGFRAFNDNSILQRTITLIAPSVVSHMDSFHLRKFHWTVALTSN